MHGRSAQAESVSSNETFLTEQLRVKAINKTHYKSMKSWFNESWTVCVQHIVKGKKADIGLKPYWLNLLVILSV